MTLTYVLRIITNKCNNISYDGVLLIMQGERIGFLAISGILLPTTYGVENTRMVLLFPLPACLLC
jgi:hypothetical protein